jgi:hypothetical protein
MGVKTQGKGVRSCNITMAKEKGTDLFFRKQHKQELPATGKRK